MRTVIPYETPSTFTAVPDPVLTGSFVSSGYPSVVPSPYPSSLYYFEPGQTVEMEKPEKVETMENGNGNAIHTVQSVNAVNSAVNNAVNTMENGQREMPMMMMMMNGVDDRKRSANDVQIDGTNIKREEAMEYMVKRRKNREEL